MLFGDAGLLRAYPRSSLGELGILPPPQEAGAAQIEPRDATNVSMDSLVVASSGWNTLMDAELGTQSSSSCCVWYVSSACAIPASTPHSITLTGTTPSTNTSTTRTRAAQFVARMKSL